METVYNSDLFKLSYTTITEHCLTTEDGAVEYSVPWMTFVYIFE